MAKPALSQFEEATQSWFRETLGEPTPAQADAWPLIKSGEHVLVAAPTGSGKTLAAFLSAIDDLVRQGSQHPLPDEVRVLYVSPLKALSNDIQKNLQAPLNGIADAQLMLGRAAADIRAMVRTGDTSQYERSKMRRQPPHILVTTPESLFILLGSESGRQMLSTVRSVIVDEIHALAGNKRGAHLSLSLARLEALTDGPLQRIGLSATQKPIARVARFLTKDAPCHIVDSGHVRERDLDLIVPDSPLTAVMAGEVWAELYDKLAAEIARHTTTLIFVNTRRLAERLTKHLAERVGEEHVAAHHGSLSKEHRLAAEQKLKGGHLRALVATASLELGIDIGEVDLVCQFASPGSIGAFLQRVGRSGHAVGATPKGRLFPTTLDELLECTALLDAVRRGELDTLPACPAASDVLSQHLVSEIACREWDEQALQNCICSAEPYKELSDKEFRQTLSMLADGYTSRRGRRGAYVHWDQVNGKLRGRRGAGLVALTNAGVIPDQFDYDVILSPEGLKIGTLNEDFAFESLPGDIFQLGNQSYRVLKVEAGRLFAEDAQGQPPTLPFWLGEAPGRSDELSQAVSRLRQNIADQLADGGPAQASQFLQKDQGIPAAAAQQLAEYLAAAQLALGILPTQKTIVFERFFDETGDMHLVVHSCFGSRVNKAWGLALRKRFCRKFNFELQAAALEDSIVLSLGITHSFPLDEVSRYLKAESVRPVLEQALLDAPMFPTHWRWNASIALAIRRHLGNRKTPPAWQRNDAEDLMAVVFPDQIACAENLSGKREIPDHPLVTQTLWDCLFDVMDLSGLEALLKRLESGDLQLHCVDLTAPSPMAQEILNARPYAFLDDGDAEARRTMAVASTANQSLNDARALSQLSVEAIKQVREQAWPLVRDADELHDALMIHAYLPDSAVQNWSSALQELQAQNRVLSCEPAGGERLWLAAERVAWWQCIYPDVPFPTSFSDEAALSRSEVLIEILRGQLECLGPLSVASIAAQLAIPVAELDAAMLALENEGFAVRGRFETGQGEQWCERRLLARIHRYSRDDRRSRFKPVSLQRYQQFLLAWHGLGSDQPEGLDALLAAFERLEGYSAAAAAWEQDILPARLAHFSGSQLDSLCAAGKLTWARISPRSGKGRARGPVKQTPIAFSPRETLDVWRQLANGDKAKPDVRKLGADASRLLECLERGGAMFFSDLQQRSGLLKTQLENALAELVAEGLVNADTFAGLRSLIQPAKAKPRSAPRTRRRRPLFDGVQDAGRWSVLPQASREAWDNDEAIEHYIWALLSRYGVLCRKLLEREAVVPPWRQLLYVAWRMEARGDICGGRFIDGVAGEQFALMEAAEALKAKEVKSSAPVVLGASDPANLSGSLLPGPKISAQLGNKVLMDQGKVCAWIAGGEPGYLPGTDVHQQARYLAMLSQRSSRYAIRPSVA